MSANARPAGSRGAILPLPDALEAAAIAAAIERFRSDTLPAPGLARQAGEDRWLEEALLAGVGLAPPQLLREPWLNI
jgi:hypothetical protein